jgi:hypothetical protein
MTSNKEPMPRDGYERFLRAQKLAEEGLGACHGKCRRTMPITELVTVVFRNTVAMSLCPNCLDTTDLVMSMKPEGLDLRLVHKGSIAL